MFERCQDEADKLRGLLRKVSAGSAGLHERLKQTDEHWSRPGNPGADRAQMFVDLERLHRLFSYFDRWIGQIQERIVKLSF